MPSCIRKCFTNASLNRFVRRLATGSDFRISPTGLAPCLIDDDDVTRWWWWWLGLFRLLLQPNLDTQGNYLIVIGGAFLPSVMHTTGGWGTGRLRDCTRRRFERNRKCDSSVLLCLGCRNDPLWSSISFVFLTLSIFSFSTHKQERTRGSGLASGWVTMPTSRCSSKLAHSRERDQ